MREPEVFFYLKHLSGNRIAMTYLNNLADPSRLLVFGKY